jgi:hypothetical protein
MKPRRFLAVLGIVLLGTIYGLGVSRVNAQEEGTTTPAEIATSTDDIVPPLDATEGSSTPEASTTESSEGTTTTPDISWPSWWPFHHASSTDGSDGTTTPSFIRGLFSWFFRGHASTTDASPTDTDTSTTTPRFNFWHPFGFLRMHDFETASTTDTAASTTPFALTPQNPGRSRRVNMIGTVTSVNGDSISFAIARSLEGSASRSDDASTPQTATVTLPQDTDSHAGHSSGETAPVAVGDMITVVGIMGDDGTITAESIRAENSRGRLHPH